MKNFKNSAFTAVTKANFVATAFRVVHFRGRLPFVCSIIDWYTNTKKQYACKHWSSNELHIRRGNLFFISLRSDPRWFRRGIVLKQQNNSFATKQKKTDRKTHNQQRGMRQWEREKYRGHTRTTCAWDATFWINMNLNSFDTRKPVSIQRNERAMDNGSTARDGYDIFDALLAETQFNTILSSGTCVCS